MVTGKPAPPPGVRPAYWDEACKHLTRKDRVMKRLIAQSDGACLQTRGDAFTTLARSILDHPKQLATDAAALLRR